jgi:hypothetical protein
MNYYLCVCMYVVLETELRLALSRQAPYHRKCTFKYRYFKVKEFKSKNKNSTHKEKPKWGRFYCWAVSNIYKKYHFLTNSSSKKKEFYETYVTLIS